MAAPKGNCQNRHSSYRLRYGAGRGWPHIYNAYGSLVDETLLKQSFEFCRVLENVRNRIVPVICLNDLELHRQVNFDASRQVAYAPPRIIFPEI